jgi:hypothetical protein
VAIHDNGRIFSEAESMKRTKTAYRSLSLFVSGTIIASMIYLVCHFGTSTPAPTYGQPPKQELARTVEALAGDVAVLKDKAADQAHAMTDVEYHISNLWFAGRAKNWPLADFYWNEALSHMKWAVRIIPVRKDGAGQEIKLAEILQSIENSPTMQIGKTIKEKDLKGFEAAYRATLEGCYACHKAADKPYLRPRIPEHPASMMINFEPNADWPK